jgi:hypothetical protein
MGMWLVTSLVPTGAVLVYQLARIGPIPPPYLQNLIRAVVHLMVSLSPKFLIWTVVAGLFAWGVSVGVYKLTDNAGKKV